MAEPSGPVVVLVGAPGSQTREVARALAVRLGLPHRDTDLDLERSTGSPLGELFVDLGEPEFRRLERHATLAALDEHRGVLSLGGGAPLDETVRARLRSLLVVAVRVPAGLAARRLGLTGPHAPLGLNPRAVFREELGRREAVYAAVARFCVDTDTAEPDEVAARIAAGLATP